MKKLIKKFIKTLGYDLVPYNHYSHPALRQKALMRSVNTDAVLDVGANIGNYGLKLMHDVGFEGEIFSFEPMAREFLVLEKRAMRYDKWKASNFALGDTETQTEINVSGNSVSSSLLGILDKHVESAPTSDYVGVEKVRVSTVDHIFELEQLNDRFKNVFLKLDVQGFEKNVLEGAKNSLDSIRTMQVEMSMVPLYQDGVLFEELFDWFRDLGYTIVSIEPGYSDKKTGQLLQIDAIFHKFK